MSLGSLAVSLVSACNQAKFLPAAAAAVVVDDAAVDADFDVVVYYRVLVLRLLSWVNGVSLECHLHRLLS